MAYAPLKKCWDEEYDCNNNEHGKCLALNNTKFNRECPFYKSVKNTPPENLVYHSLSIRGCDGMDALKGEDYE